MSRILLLALFALSIFGSISAKSLYITYLNQFSPFYNAKDTCHNIQLKDKVLLMENKFSDNMIVVDSLSEGFNKFKFYVRIASLNNDETKSYACRNRHTNKKTNIKNPAVGVVWSYTDSENYYAVMTRCTNSDLHSYYDTRNMIIDIIQVENARTSLIKSVALDEDVNLQNGYNVISIEFDGNSTFVAVGDKELRQIAEITGIDYYSGSHKCGVLIGAAAKVGIERMVMFTEPIMEEVLATQWTRQSLDSYLNSANNIYEGYWKFFDKELEEDKLKMGGRYTVALVKNDNGFDIIYVNGANVNNTSWKSGML